MKKMILVVSIVGGLLMGVGLYSGDKKTLKHNKVLDDKIIKISKGIEKIDEILVNKKLNPETKEIFRKVRSSYLMELEILKEANEVFAGE